MVIQQLYKQIWKQLCIHVLSWTWRVNTFNMVSKMNAYDFCSWKYSNFSSAEIPTSSYAQTGKYGYLKGSVTSSDKWLLGQKIMNANPGDIFQPLKAKNTGQGTGVSSHFYMNSKKWFLPLESLSEIKSSHHFFKNYSSCICSLKSDLSFLIYPDIFPWVSSRKHYMPQKNVRIRLIKNNNILIKIITKIGQMHPFYRLIHIAEIRKTLIFKTWLMNTFKYGWLSLGRSSATQFLWTSFSLSELKCNRALKHA